MKRLSERATPRFRELLFAVLLALAARVVHGVVGFRFDFENVEWYMQFLDLRELREHYVSSLLHLHAQPPLLNALLGLFLKAERAACAAGLVFAACGVARDVLLFLLARQMTGASRVAWVVLLLVLANPAYAVYDNYFFYTPLVQLGLVGAAFALARFAENPTLRSYTGYCLALVTVTLTRSLYHPLWALVALLLPLPVLRRLPRAMLVAVGAALLLAAWPVKNLALFGQATSSSWMGMNLFNSAYNQSFTAAELRRYYAGEPMIARRPTGSEGPLALIKPFSPPERYTPFFPPTRTGVPVLDDLRRSNGHANYNHSVYLAASAAYQSEYLKLVRRDPAVLPRIFLSSLSFFIQPPAEHDVLRLSPVTRRNLEVAAPWDAAFRSLVYWPLLLPGEERTLSVSLLLALAAVLVGIPLASFLCTDARRSRGVLAPAFVWWSAAYATLFGNLFENYENMRFRFEVEPLLLVGCAFLAACSFGKRRA